MNEITEFNAAACDQIMKYHDKTIDSINVFLNSPPHPRHAPVKPKPQGERDVRIAVLNETIETFNQRSTEIHAFATKNMNEWATTVLTNHVSQKQKSRKKECQVFITELDWGELALQMTKQFGTTFAVLNMANANTPGGGYLEGCAAQEENMFRRTDCHFSILVDGEVQRKYTPEQTRQINAQSREVYLDIEKPRICIRGREYPRPINQKCTLENIGYEFLSDNNIFRFYELRVAALDLRNKPPFGDKEYIKTSQRIQNMLTTLKKKGIRHVILGAFGCGAFENPAEYVADIFKRAISEMRNDFDVIAFGIYHAGYGPVNFQPFKDAFADWPPPLIAELR